MLLNPETTEHTDRAVASTVQLSAVLAVQKWSGAIDVPDGLRVHDIPVPLLGGVAVLLACCVPLVLGPRRGVVVRALVGESGWDGGAVFGGVRVSDQAQVMSTRWAPIPGLYACGEMVGGLFHTNYPGGTGLMSGAVFGRLAGAAAAGAEPAGARRCVPPARCAA